MINFIKSKVKCILFTCNVMCTVLLRRDVPVGVPLDLSTMEWHELPKYNGIQVS